MLRYERVKVKRDERTTHNRAVAPWEIPMLEFLFGEGNVEALGEYEIVRQDYPAPQEEFHRLKVRYGRNPETHEDNVVSVFGNARRGVEALSVMIDKAREADTVAALAMRKSFSRDPLLA